jgi:magnesium-transporting ATPase (P-type)
MLFLLEKVLQKRTLERTELQLIIWALLIILSVCILFYGASEEPFRGMTWFYNVTFEVIPFILICDLIISAVFTLKNKPLYAGIAVTIINSVLVLYLTFDMYGYIADLLRN